MSIFVAAVNQVPLTPTVDFGALFSAILRGIFSIRYDIVALIGKDVYVVLQFVGTFAILVLIIGIVYVSIKTREIEIIMAAQHVASEKIEVSKESVHKVKWQRILDHADSVNPGDWRLAILEADILLDEMLDDMGIYGETIADKLKNVNEAALPGVQRAWEAHLVRNQIAHEGPNFELNQREARRIIGLFDAVLRQGGYL